MGNVYTLNIIKNFSGVGILHMWTSVMDYVTQNNSSS